MLLSGGCYVQVDSHGVVSVTPDFNKDRPAHRVENRHRGTCVCVHTRAHMHLCRALNSKLLKYWKQAVNSLLLYTIILCQSWGYQISNIVLHGNYN